MALDILQCDPSGSIGLLDDGDGLEIDHHDVVLPPYLSSGEEGGPGCPQDALGDIDEDEGEVGDPWGELAGEWEALAADEDEEDEGGATEVEGEDEAGEWVVTSEEEGDRERDTVNGYRLPPVSPPRPHLVTRNSSLAHQGRSSPNNSKCQRALYAQLDPIRILALDCPTPDGYEDPHALFESLLIDASSEYGWRNLHSEYLLEWFGRTYQRIIGDLVSWGRIEEDRWYIVGSHCRRYRLHAACRGVPVVYRRIHQPALLARAWRAYGALADKEAELLSDPTMRVLYDSAARVTFDLAAVPDLSDTVYTPEDRTKLGVVIARALRIGEAPYLREHVDGRLYTGYTNVPRWLKSRAARIDGEPIVAFDVRASHWVSFVEAYAASEEARPEEVAILQDVYRRGDWTRMGGKQDRNEFLCGGDRPKARLWLKTHAPHALKWFLARKLARGRGIAKDWVAGERRRARAVYAALIDAGITTILDMHDGFDVRAQDAARAFAIASSALGGFAILEREDGEEVPASAVG